MGRYVPNIGCTSGSSGGSMTQADADNRYVQKAGDTMSGHLAFATTGVGVQRKSPDGSTWTDSVANDGALTTTK